VATRNCPMAANGRVHQAATWLAVSIDATRASGMPNADFASLRSGLPLLRRCYVHSSTS
jgi:hypothetical protein